MHNDMKLWGTKKDNDDLIPNVTYLLLKYGVSIELYNELAMVFDDLPESYKV